MDSLTDAQRNVLREAALEAQAGLAKANAEGERTLFNELRSKGMEITEKPDVSAFVEASRKVHQQYIKDFGQAAYDEAIRLGK
jgi:TRAP-type C4-dicarboxylate transport system substrate-binding protein